MCFSFRLVVKQKVAWIFFFVKFSKFYGMAVKKLCFLSEVVLRTVKRRLAATFAIFFGQKKWRLEILSSPAILKRILRLKNSEYVAVIG